jgi:hypothetical protein
MASLSCLRLGVPVGWGTPGFLCEKGWKVTGVVRVSSEILVNDIGVPIPVMKGALGILSNESALRG